MCASASRCSRTWVCRTSTCSRTGRTRWRRSRRSRPGRSSGAGLIVGKISADDPRANYKASDTIVDQNELREFLDGKHRWVLSTTRNDGRPQMSLVTGGMLADGRLAVSTYPERVKARNVRRNPLVSVAVMGSEFNDAWVQIDGDAVVGDLPEAGDDFVEYYRSISGEHPDWDEYRAAMAEQGKCLILVTPTRWSPVSKGGFPPSLFED
ncbi:MAG: PPOX class F420-dependent oxidoreductase [Ilumatobacteraceae bacterium]|nr:PPOX class F420-dependent oxidoreductase [Ilumatobacteraceae bacterium]